MHDGPTDGDLARQVSGHDTRWRKSSHSNPSGECVELAVLDDGVRIAIRDSKNPGGPALVFDAEEVCAFVDAVQDGRYDWVYAHSRYQQVDGGMLIHGGSGESGPGA